MPVNISSLVQDPEFRALPVAEKRLLLSEGDPEFSNLNDQEIEQFAPPILQKTVYPQEGVMTGTPVNQDLIETIPLVGAREQFSEGMKSGTDLLGQNLAGDLAGLIFGSARAAGTVFNPVSKAVGMVPRLAGATGSLAGGDLDAALSNITGAQPVESAIQIPSVDTGIPLFDVPLNTAGNIGQEVVNQPIILAGATPGSLSSQVGAVRSGASAARNIGSTVSETASKMRSRVAPATVEQSAMAALDFTTDQVQQHIPVVTQRVSSLIGKIPQTADEGVKFIDDAKQQLYDERLEVNNAATQQGLVVKGDTAVQMATEALDSIPNLKATERTAILDDIVERYSGDKTPDQGQSIQQRLNKEFEAQYENGTFDRAAPANEAKLAIRNSFAQQMDEINQAVTGQSGTPYADIGSLIEVKGSLIDKINKIKGTEAARKTGIEKAPSRVPTTRAGVVEKAGKTILTPFRKSQLEKLDQNVQRIFSESPKQPPSFSLEQSLVDQLRQAKTPSAASASLETQIQERIRSYPRNIRSDPALARLAAESELGLR